MSRDLEYDIVVVGGGIAGIAAAVKASRMGAKVALVEYYDFIGGMSTAGMVSPFMKHTINGTPLVRGIFEDLEIEMRRRKGMIDNGFYAHAFRSSAFHLLKSSGCDLFLNSAIENVSVEEALINGISIRCGGKLLELTARYLIDASGDAQLLYLGNFPWIKGEVKKGDLQALTLFFRMNNIKMNSVLDYVKKDEKDFFDWMEFDFKVGKIISVAGFFNIIKDEIRKGNLPGEINYIFFTTLPESDEASFNTTNIIGIDGSTSEGLTKAEIIGRDQVERLVEVMKNRIPGFENSQLLETAVQVGVRETRRAVGEYSVTGKDISGGEKFSDAIARGCYGIDIHGQKNEESRLEDLSEGEFYEIPFRSLLVKESANLMAAGRCISSTHEGQSALRIMPTSAATGEACGASAAIALRNNCNLRDIEYAELKQEIADNLS